MSESKKQLCRRPRREGAPVAGVSGGLGSGLDVSAQSLRCGGAAARGPAATLMLGHENQAVSIRMPPAVRNMKVTTRVNTAVSEMSDSP